ncbi:hypothetical protein [Rhodococcus erythropolis]|uniref:hypothetical protein n=1 Tax=Rhodococcus erythropolis TaxID=1833 RepID=UPI00114CA719|nr:hypothetical protein [Rhodococcus erythropolis]
MSDTSANHPKVLSVFEHPEWDDRLVNEVFGFIMRCAAQSGAHLTDYVVSRGTAVLIGGQSRVDFLLRVSMFAKLLTEIDIDERVAYKIVDDDPEFIHLRLREEVEFERQRRNDAANPSLTIPVRLRDGDACRWCGNVVDWNVRKASRSGTYDHLEPGRAATVDTYVVACVGCNSSRKDGSHPREIPDLLGVPAAPYYSVKTINYLESNEWRKRNDLPVPPRPRTKIKPGQPAPGITPAASTRLSPATAASTAPAGTRPDNQSGNAASSTLDTATAARPVTPAPRTDNSSANAPSNQRSGHHPENAPDQASSAQTANLQEPSRKLADSADDEGTELAGTGRDGSGRDGSGRDGNRVPYSYPPSESVPVRNSSRGRRRRKRGRGTQSQNRSSGDLRG